MRGDDSDGEANAAAAAAYETSDEADVDAEEGAAEPEMDGWDDLADAPVEADADDQFVGSPCSEKDEVVIGEDGEAVQMPRVLPAPTRLRTIAATMGLPVVELHS